MSGNSASLYFYCLYLLSFHDYLQAYPLSILSLEKFWENVNIRAEPRIRLFSGVSWEQWVRIGEQVMCGSMYSYILGIRHQRCALRQNRGGEFPKSSGGGCVNGAPSSWMGVRSCIVFFFVLPIIPMNFEIPVSTCEARWKI